jgi:hypothetical protein
MYVSLFCGVDVFVFHDEEDEGNVRDEDEEPRDVYVTVVAKVLKKERDKDGDDGLDGYVGDGVTESGHEDDIDEMCN